MLGVAISKDWIAASGSADATARLWDLSTGSRLFTLEAGSEVRCVAFSGDGKMLASGEPDKLVRVWNVKTGERVQTLQGMTTPIYELGVSDDGNIVAAAGGVDGKIWDLQTCKVLMSFEGRFELSPDGRTLATARGDGGINLTNVATGKPIRVLTGHLGYANVLQLSPDSLLLASGGA